jgi:hypothetical protein
MANESFLIVLVVAPTEQGEIYQNFAGVLADSGSQPRTWTDIHVLSDEGGAVIAYAATHRLAF